MSKPKVDKTENPIGNCRNELVSAMSALNMQPTSIKDPEENAIYLSELDEWAAHAYEHLQAALQSLSYVSSDSVGKVVKDRDEEFADYILSHLKDEDKEAAGVSIDNLLVCLFRLANYPKTAKAMEQARKVLWRA